MGRDMVPSHSFQPRFLPSVGNDYSDGGPFSSGGPSSTTSGGAAAAGLRSRAYSVDSLYSLDSARDSLIGGTPLVLLKDSNPSGRGPGPPGSATTFALLGSHKGGGLTGPSSLRNFAGSAASGTFSPSSGGPSASIGTPQHQQQHHQQQQQQRRRRRQPFQSSADHVRHPADLKPGRHALQFFRHYGRLTIPMVASLLHGRPLIVLAEPEHESAVRALVATLWLFVPGQSAHQEIVPWRETTLSLRDLAHLKLAGLSKSCAHGGIPTSVSRHVSVLDFEREVLRAPAYQGVFLRALVDPCRHWRSNGTCLAHIHHAFLRLACKSFLYYHLWCLDKGSAATEVLTPVPAFTSASSTTAFNG
eukprot:UC1_evm1s431